MKPESEHISPASPGDARRQVNRLLFISFLTVMIVFLVVAIFPATSSSSSGRTVSVQAKEKEKEIPIEEWGRVVTLRSPEWQEPEPKVVAGPTVVPFQVPIPTSDTCATATIPSQAAFQNAVPGAPKQ